MKENNLKQILSDIGKQEIPSNIDLWSKLEGKMTVQTKSRKVRLSIGPKSRLGWVFLLTFVLFLFGGTLYATSSVLRNLIHLDPGLESVDLSELGQTVNLSQTVDSTTVTLEWAYADANRITLAFSIEDSEGQRFDPHQSNLIDASGTVYPGRGGFGLVGTSDSLKVELPPGESLHVISFDGSSVTNNSTSLDLQFEVELEEFYLSSTVKPSATLTENEDGTTTTIVEAGSASSTTLNIIGPFVFNFEVPFNPGRIVEPKQVVTVNDVGVRLDKVVATPSETAVTLCFNNTNPAYDDWTALPTLIINWQRYEAGLISQGRASNPNCQIAYFNAVLFNENGNWQLQVKELIGSKSDTPGPSLQISGPWNFRFEMP